MTDEEDEYELYESMPSLRRAASAARDGVLHLGYGLYGTVAEQHGAVRAVFALVFWFFGNWTYNRIAPLLSHAIRDAVSRVSLSILRVSTLEAAGRNLAGNV